jgi:hypothetical protein
VRLQFIVRTREISPSLDADIEKEVIVMTSELLILLLFIPIAAGMMITVWGSAQLAKADEHYQDMVTAAEQTSSHAAATTET